MRRVILDYEAGAWGRGTLVVEDRRLVHHELPRRSEPTAASAPTPNDPQGIPEIPAQSVSSAGGSECAESVPILLARRLSHRLSSYFEGEVDAFDDVELDLEWCTPFQRAVVDALRAVPRGEVVTYGELAALAGHPGAQRAAGSFCARNPFPILVPCHRVVAADGLGSYGSLGVGYKRRLLELEGAVLG